MTLWHGYPQHPDAHPERPWWRRYVSPLDGSTGWTRYAHDGTSPVVLDSEVEPHEDADGDEAEAVLLEALAAKDAAYPVPPPPPLCGQVWVCVADGEVLSQDMVTNVIEWHDGSTRLILGARECRIPASMTGHGVKPWPPPGAVLVAGLLAPWAPMEGE